MTGERLAFEADFIFRAGTLEPDHLRVTGFSGQEAISGLYSFRVDLCSLDAQVDGDALLSKPCTLEIAGPSGARFVNGMVRLFERLGEGNKLTHYAAEIAPVHWLLTKRFNSRIFQSFNCEDMTPPGIIKKVLKDAGIPDDHQRFALQRDYDAREYVVQYRETEFDFISRLMEEEGIFYFFEHSADGHKMVFGDSDVAHSPNALGAKFPFRAANALVPEKEFVYAVRDRRVIQFGAVCLEDFNFKRPGVDIRATAQSKKGSTGLEFSEYPGRYVEKKAGERYAQIRLEEFQARKRLIDMQATARVLVPGFKFALGDHPAEKLNAEYLITSVRHTGLQPQAGEDETASPPEKPYVAELTTILADVPFRPARITPRPQVVGSQTAIVVGGAEDEILTDKFGAVKVQFHWDREGTFDENSSCFIRVSQAFAGGRYGSIFLPRVGQEVIVDFIDGDPDRPLITGRVYNGELMPPYPLPEEKTRSTTKTHSTKGGGGCNEVRFEDLKGQEQVLIFAQRNLDVNAQAERMSSVGGSDHLTVGKERRVKTGGMYSEQIGGGQTTEIKGQRLLNITGDLLVHCDGNHIQASSIYNYNAGTIHLYANDGIYLTCGASTIAVLPGEIFIDAPTVHINDGSAAPPEVDASPNWAQAPAGADSTKPGADVRFSGGGVVVPPLEPEKLEKRKTFVEFQLLDSARDKAPVPNERVRVRLPDGSVHESATDGEGIVRFENIDPGNAEVQFPDRADAEWTFLRVERPD